MIALTIDGRRATASPGSYLLQAARAAGARIPTLCDHPALEPYGGCRLCLVEIGRPEWGDWRKLVVSCLYPVEEGLVVHTASERVLQARRVTLDLLLARCPDTPLVVELARAHGVLATSYRRAETPTDCILCARCTRVCDRVGASAISMSGRGVGREVAPPFHRPPPGCVGCLACAEVCPTGHIRAEEGAGRRAIWGREFRLVPCRRCGRGHLTEDQLALERRRGLLHPGSLELCDRCKREALAGRLAGLAGA